MRRRVIRSPRLVIGVLLVAVLTAGSVLAIRLGDLTGHRSIVAYFLNSNGLYPGDEVVILGVPVGEIDSIEPQPERAKVTFHVDDQYKVPADAKAVILSPTLVSARQIQLTPAYTRGPEMTEGAVIPQNRTAVPVEFDDLRAQLQRLAEALQPTTPGGVSTLGAFVNTAADNLRGEGDNIRNAIIEMSQAFSALGDHSPDLFSTMKNLSVFISALQSSHGLLRSLNQNLAEVTGLLADDPDEVGRMIESINSVVGDVQSFTSDNRESLGTASDKLASISAALVESTDDIKQLLHVAPNSFINYVNIYQPAQGSLTGALAYNNFATPVDFLCGAIQAASREGAEQSAKLCAQYLAPIIKNRQYNFLPFGENLFVGAAARPNEVTYSEDRLRPNYVPPAPEPAQSSPAGGSAAEPVSLPNNALPANPQSALPPIQSTDPNAGLEGLMVPPEGGS
ncbi:Uncharacterised protein [Mycolicibacterium vanbaalenii]|uniref:Uncharacterized protein n=1 Tax=Mycolicibacterium vanbaalenii TaxID=110539 RepID=A0A5S9RBX6_MYCVN|nr:MCE family protein [Mycolicibacterium vanbaalenii]CAA0137644.1 Uncharacterised protein [Mycolicibacterium vanbaalenii]